MENERLKKVAQLLQGASEDELEKISNLAWDMLKEARKRSAQLAILDFSVGDEVEVVQGLRRLPVGVLGRVEKLGSHMLVVDFGNSGLWRVPPSLVKRTGKKAKPSKARPMHRRREEIDPEIIAGQKGLV